MTALRPDLVPIENRQCFSNRAKVGLYGLIAPLRGRGSELSPTKKAEHSPSAARMCLHREARLILG